MTDRLKEKIKLADGFILDYFKKDEKNPVFKAMNYSISCGGKRVRPLITLLCCEALGGKAQDALYFAAAVEMVHTYSLIHDDLPAMDNDDLRRGKPTNHKVFGEAMAILAGDALLTEAFYAISSAKLSSDKKSLATGILSYMAGAHGMVFGQALDMEKPDNVMKVINMYERKTSDMLRAAAALGAAAAGGAGDEFDEYARCLGVAFQIRDDILDITSDEATLGKPIGSDEKNEKATILKYMSVRKAENMAEALTQRAEKSLEFLGDKADDLRELAKVLIDRKY